MPVLKIFMQADGMLEGRLPDYHVTEPISVGVLEGGMASGKPSVGIAMTLPDGKVVLAETSLELFLGAAAAFKARYGWQCEQEGSFQ